MTTQSSADLTAEGLVHDLNNVFTTILDAAELLDTDPEWRAMAAILQRNVGRGRRILEGYFETGGALFDLGPALEEAVQFASDWLRVQGMEVAFQRVVPPGVRLRGSAIAWERALFNLLLNAAQAMPGGGTVEIAVRQVAGRVEINVRDNGPGIDEGVLPSIFEAGFSTKSRRGLGLHIVKSVVEHAGGTVWAGNRTESRGALFRILVPDPTVPSLR